MESQQNVNIMLGFVGIMVPPQKPVKKNVKRNDTINC